MASAAMFEKTCSFRDRISTQTGAATCKESEKKESCRETRCELVGFDVLPEYLKDNEFILNYYRSEWPLKETILSIFSIHNETLNIWTHLIGFSVFLALTVYAVAIFGMQAEPLGSSEHDSTRFQANASTLHSSYNFGYTITLPLASFYDVPHKIGESPAARWPFFAFLVGAMACLLASSACHLLMCHSAQCAYKMLRLDYAGISTLIVTSFYPVVYYTFMCDPFFCKLYIGFITAIGVGTVVMSLVPVFQTPEFRAVRSLLFACMAVSGLVPIVHKVVVFGNRPEAIVTAQYEAMMGVFYGVGVVIYAARIPERWMPGKFDLVGHSHQLFHVLVIAGAYTHYLAGLEYLKWRDIEGC